MSSQRDERLASIRARQSELGRARDKLWKEERILQEEEELIIAQQHLENSPGILAKFEWELKARFYYGTSTVSLRAKANDANDKLQDELARAMHIGHHGNKDICKEASIHINDGETEIRFKEESIDGLNEFIEYFIVEYNLSVDRSELGSVLLDIEDKIANMQCIYEDLSGLYYGPIV